MIAYSAMLDVPRELVRHLAGLLAAERRARGTRRGTRALTCFYQALLILIWFRKQEDATLLGAGFGISRATAYRYLDEGIRVLAACRPDLHEALRRTAADGWAFVILDGKLFDCDRVTESVSSVKGNNIDACDRSRPDPARQIGARRRVGQLHRHAGVQGRPHSLFCRIADVALGGMAGFSVSSLTAYRCRVAWCGHPAAAVVPSPGSGGYAVSRAWCRIAASSTGRLSIGQCQVGSSS